MTPKPATMAPACAETLALEKTAAADGASPQSTLDATNAGLASNQRCGDSVMHPVNEGFLLSLRAMAKFALHRDDWRSDFEHANGLLAQCESRRDKAAAQATAVCKTQQEFNERFIAEYAPPSARPSPGQPQTLPAPLVAPVNPPSMAPAGSAPPTTASSTPPIIGPVPPPPPPPAAH